MIDSLVLQLNEQTHLTLHPDLRFAEKFFPPGMPGWEVHLETTKRTSYYRKILGAKAVVIMCHSESGLTIAGPAFKDDGYWLCATCRINVPKLAGLPPAWLPTTHAEYQYALNNVAILLSWLPVGWMERATVKRLDLCMNFDFTEYMSVEDIISAHELMRHRRVRSDPFRFKPRDNTLYWKGKNTVIAMYEKTAEIYAKIAKAQKIAVADVRARYHFNRLVRLEFRLKSKALATLIDRVTPEIPVAAGIPPFPRELSQTVGLLALNADLLVRMFRDMALEMGNLPVRIVERLQTPTFLAMLINQKFVSEDGLPVVEFAARFMSDKQIKDAKKTAGVVDFGNPMFRWSNCLGDSEWGPYADPKPACFRDMG